MNVRVDYTPQPRPILIANGVRDRAGQLCNVFVDVDDDALVKMIGAIWADSTIARQGIALAAGTNLSLRIVVLSGQR